MPHEGRVGPATDINETFVVYATHNIGVVYGVIVGEMSMIADVLDGKTATTSRLNTGIFAKRTPGITHLHLVKSTDDSAERAVADGAGGVVGAISIIADSSSTR